MYTLLYRMIQIKAKLLLADVGSSPPESGKYNLVVGVLNISVFSIKKQILFLSIPCFRIQDVTGILVIITIHIYEKNTTRLAMEEPELLESHSSTSTNNQSLVSVR